MAIVLFTLLVIGMFVFAFLKRTEIRDEQVAPSIQATDVVEDPYASITRIDAVHFFIDGVHTVVGEVIMPTPCDLLDGSTRVAESFPEQITLDFRVINNADQCITQLTAQRFKLSAVASETARFNALFNNRVVELNLTPAAPGETPDDFEVFIKG